MNPIIFIPARMASTRLPGKPLAEIAGLPMIIQVLRRAQEAKIGPIVVATDTPQIKEDVEKYQGKAILTSPSHASGSDRIFEALEKYDPEGIYDPIINLQGDLPTIPPQDIKSVLAPLENPSTHLATLISLITQDEEHANPNVVKCVGTPISPQRLRALYFTRGTAPWGEGPRYHHIGIYAWRRQALKHFISLPPSILEQRERLEQLRALEHNMRIDAELVSSVPLGVDTPEDLQKARDILEGK